jgi:hypothetical protein
VPECTRPSKGRASLKFYGWAKLGGLADGETEISDAGATMLIYRRPARP